MNDIIINTWTGVWLLIGLGAFAWLFGLIEGWFIKRYVDEKKKEEPKTEVEE